MPSSFSALNRLCLMTLKSKYRHNKRFFLWPLSMWRWRYSKVLLMTMKRITDRPWKKEDFFIIIYISLKDFFYKSEVHSFQEIEAYAYLHENAITISGSDFIASVSVSNCGKVDLIGQMQPLIPSLSPTLGFLKYSILNYRGAYTQNTSKCQNTLEGFLESIRKIVQENVQLVIRGWLSRTIQPRLKKAFTSPFDCSLIFWFCFVVTAKVIQNRLTAARLFSVTIEVLFW